ncbi:MAG: sigma 54-interacting transcriptional regulator [Bacillaceae bacterium]|nr:sigma 54-interacting transcriptional regulator [Bacillaceae bacterium]
MDKQQQKRMEELELLNRELEAILDASFDEIFVTDGQGITLRVNRACERLYGIQAEALIGMPVQELEQRGFFNPSAAMKAIETRERVTLVQDTREGGRLVVTANPVLNEQGEVTRVICTAKDLTELSRIQKQLFKAEQRAEQYKKELTRLKKIESQAPITQNKHMIQLLENAKRVAESNAPVLVTGESGTGKEVMVNYIHQCSHRASRPLVKINCGAIPESLVESELFGYEKGAFTGAESRGKKGVFEEADGGTLFLDEIGELPYTAQAKLLQVLQDGRFIKVGGTRTRQVDVRIVAATNRDLTRLIQEHKFREDLYYRLNVFTIHLPLLKERIDDLPILSEYFLEHFRIKYERARKLSPETLEMMKSYDWPGNVRELHNTLERLVVMTDETEIRPQHLASVLPLFSTQLEIPVMPDSPDGPVRVHSLFPLKKAVDLVEKQLIQMALKQGKTTYEAARLLGVNQSTIVRKMKKYDIDEH